MQTKEINKENLEYLISRNMTVKQIANEFNVSYQKIEKDLRRYELRTNHFNNYYKNQKLYSLNPKVCKLCSSEIRFKDRDHDYCSMACYRQSKTKRTCKCGNPILGKRIYCSKECQYKYQYGFKIEQWLSGDWLGTNSNGDISSTVRNYLLKQANHSCTICGWNKINLITGNCPLNIDHIDGNYLNNRPENLRVICPNCHSLTPTYGSLNKGNGRPWHVVKL